MKNLSKKEEDHICSLNFPKSLKNRYTNEKSFNYKFFELFIISEENPLTSRNFMSRFAIENEIKRQVYSKYFYMIHPYSKFSLYWQSFIMIIHYIHLMFLCFIMTYCEIKNTKISLITSTVICSICMFDVFLNMFTGIIGPSGNKIYLNQVTVLLHYFRGYFIIEFLSAIPYDVLMCSIIVPIDCSSYNYNMDVWNSIGYIKILLLPKFFKYLKNFANIYTMDEVRFRILNLILLTTVVTHLTTCISMKILTSFADETETNAGVLLIMNSTYPVKIKYLRSLFFISKAMHGSDLTDLPTIKLIGFSHVMLIFSYAFLLYNVVQVMQIYKLKTSSKMKYDEIINQVQQYMKHKQLPIKMQQRLLLFYQRRYRGFFFDEAAIIKSLSEPLRRDIIIHCGKLFIDKVAIFQNISRDALSQIVACLKSEAYLPNDTIIKAGSFGECMYFLLKGTAAVMTPTGREVCHLEDGAHFGEIALIVKDRKRVANVIAVEFCDIYRLDKKDFFIHMPPQSNVFLNIEKIAMERLEEAHIMEEQYKNRLYNNTLFYT